VKLGWKEQALGRFEAYQAAGGDDPQVAAAIEALRAQGGRLGALPEADQGGPWSMGAELGYGWGFNSDGYGHAYNRNNNGSLFSYSYSVGEGVQAALEADYRVSPNLSVGLWSAPLSTDVSSSQTLSEWNGLTRTVDSVAVKHLAIPVLLNLRTRAQFGPRIHVSTFAGVGALFTQPYTEDGSQVQTDPVGTLSTSSHYQRALSNGMVFRAGMGAEVALTRRARLFFNGSLLLGRLPATGSSFSSSTVGSGGYAGYKGSVNASTSYVLTPPTSLPSAQELSATASPGPNRTVTRSFDDGTEQYTQVDVFSGGNLVSQDFTEVNTLGASNGSDDINYKVLAATLGLQWEF
jgi:hypothetical protein